VGIEHVDVVKIDDNAQLLELVEEQTDLTYALYVVPDNNPEAV
jgi:hypothetical protein